MGMRVAGQPPEGNQPTEPDRPVLIGGSGMKTPPGAAGNDQPRYRVIVAVDIEGSTSRTDAMKAEMRRTLYHLLEEALSKAGIRESHRDTFVDRGDGVLALIHALDTAPKTLLLRNVIPALAASLGAYNSRPNPSQRIRVRVVVHAGETRHDGRGNFGEALDIAFRLLDSPRTKTALARAKGPLTLVVSEDIYRSIVRHGYTGIPAGAYVPLVRVEVAGRRHRGWVHDPAGALACDGSGPVPRLASWWAARLRAFGQGVFAATDEEAHRHGWRVEERSGGLRRRYRDPRFDRLITCPQCRGSGRTPRGSCARCRATGRVMTGPKDRRP